MLHGCAFPGCETLTLSPYCFEHERIVRAEIEAQRTQIVVLDEPTTAELAPALQSV